MYYISVFRKEEVIRLQLCYAAYTKYNELKL
jgi:hypothetical protein